MNDIQKNMNDMHNTTSHMVPIDMAEFSSCVKAYPTYIYGCLASYLWKYGDERHFAFNEDDDVVMLPFYITAGTNNFDVNDNYALLLKKTTGKIILLPFCEFLDEDDLIARLIMVEELNYTLMQGELPERKKDSNEVHHTNDTGIKGR